MKLVDTDVVIWFMRGNAQAARALATPGTFALSAVTCMELVQGVRDKTELTALRRQLLRWRAPIVHADGDISARALHLLEQHALSHGMRMAVALLAATALDHAMPLLTGNRKYYTFVAGLDVDLFTP